MAVFVLTHHPREPLIKGETTFTFVTDGIGSALEQAQAAASGKDVSIAGGADVIQQYLAAGLIDQLQVNVVPVLLGSGTRLLDHLEGAEINLEPIRAVPAPDVTHLRYQVLR
jgi:dihydrofolate reductase